MTFEKILETIAPRCRSGAIAIDYAYPSSPLADREGYPDGCWVVRNTALPLDCQDLVVCETARFASRIAYRIDLPFDKHWIDCIKRNRG